MERGVLMAQTCSPLRAWEIITSPLGLRSNKITLPLCLNRGAPATYNLLPFARVSEDTVYPAVHKTRPSGDPCRVSKQTHADWEAWYYRLQCTRKVCVNHKESQMKPPTGKLKGRRQNGIDWY